MSQRGLRIGQMHEGDPVDRILDRTLKGTYRIDRLIAHGGMGAVYEAQHLRLHRRVAVKVLLGRYASDPYLVELFRREAEIVAQVGHPHIVQVLDVDESEETGPFFVMEYLEGETVAERLRRVGPFPILDAIRVACEAAAALAQVHALGVVHCDLKPTNLFLVRVTSQTDFVKLLDFGISTELEHETRQRNDEVVGTPNYMAPEQATGKGQRDHRVDQFALAAIAFELLSGCKAFPGKEAEQVLQQVIESDPPPLSEVAPWVPSVFDSVLRRALSKNSKDRFSSVSAFAWALENAVIDSGMDQQARVRRGAKPGRHSVAPDASETSSKLESWRPIRSSEPPTNVEGKGPTIEEPSPGCPATPAATNGMGPEALLNDARHHRAAGRLDEAVASAERLLELAVYDKTPAALKTLSSGIPALDAIFEARVGEGDRVISIGAAMDRLRYTLSPCAAQLAARIEEPTSVADLITKSGIPRRDCVRLIAGMLRRGALVTS